IARRSIMKRLYLRENESRVKRRKGAQTLDSVLSRPRLKKKRKSTTCASSQIERALQRGRRSARPFSWLLSSPQQPLETEDPPTVSLAPQYTSQRSCRAIEIFSCSKIHEKSRILARFRRAPGFMSATLS